MLRCNCMPKATILSFLVSGSYFFLFLFCCLHPTFYSVDMASDFNPGGGWAVCYLHSCIHSYAPLFFLPRMMCVRKNPLRKKSVCSVARRCILPRSIGKTVGIHCLSSEESTLPMHWCSAKMKAKAMHS
jgi:hypothetical protein